MTRLRILAARLRGLLAKGRRDRELADEIESHLALSVEENLNRGMDPVEARREALRAFGGVEQTKEAYRDARGLAGIETLLQDLRYALRILRKSPGFAAAAALSIAIGIGANTAIFSLINAVLLRTLPVERPEQLVVFAVGSSRGSDYSFSYPQYVRLRDGATALSSVIASNGASRMRMVVGASTGAGTRESVQAEKVSGNFFSALGVEAELGRTLTDADDRDGAPPVAVISYGLWQRRFGLDPKVLGKSIILDDVPFMIVGVAPRRFFGFEVGASPEVWWPLHQLPRVARGTVLGNQGWTWLRLMGRLAPRASLAQAHAESSVIFERTLAEADQAAASAPESAWTPAERRRVLEQRLVLEPGSTGWTRLRQLRMPLLLLMAVVGLVLLIACANVASLLMARAFARQKEIAMRLAIGASRARIVRQLLTESVLLALLGGGLGLLGALWGTRLLLTYLSDFMRTVFPQRAMALDVTPDGRVLGFTIGVSVATGILFGLAPALRATRLDLTSALKELAGPRRRGRSRLVLNRTLVVSQVAVSLFLLVGTGLLVRSLQNLRSLDAGFDSDNVILFLIDVGGGYDTAGRTRVYQEVIERLGALPGARSATLSKWGLLSPNTWGNRVLVDGYTPRPDEDLRCYGQIVGPRFFETFGIPLRSGREFGPQDGPTAPRVAVINETMARHFFGHQDPVGRHFRLPASPAVAIEIVGVAKDAKYRNLREQPTRTFYVPFLQQPSDSGPGNLVALRTGGSPASVVPAVRRTLEGIDSQLQVVDLRTMADVVDASLVQERFVSHLASFFSAAALLLAALGLYGVMSYGVARRTAEIGIRMALGARRRDVLWLVLREALALAFLGAAIGLPAGLLGTRAISSLLFGLSPSDPVTLTLATAVLLAVAAVAGYLPARRAARVDPLIALRYE
jgi:predicted permease